jgi:pilus assembly protein FimV
MFRVLQLSFTKALCLVMLSWSCTAAALSLGSPQLLSRPGEPLRVEIPIRLAPEDQPSLNSLNVLMQSKTAYSRLGISSKILDLNPQAMVYRNQQDRLMVLVETIEAVPMSDDPFLDLLINLNWSSGSISKTFTLLLGDVQKITVKPGQTLSEIAAQITPQLDGATLDQTIVALFKANPDAFASGSINRLAAGAQLTKPSQALLRSISPAEANHFVADAYAQANADQSPKAGGLELTKGKPGNQESTPADRLKIGSSTEGNAEQRRYTEELVAQEKQLEQTRARVAELEKSIADLQGLLQKVKQQKSAEPNFGLGNFAPAAVAVALIALTGLLLWFLARNARRSELQDYSKPIHAHAKAIEALAIAMPERAKALFAGIDLDLAKPVTNIAPTPTALATPSSANISDGPLADTLRVKLNLARAYITIEDFAAAKKSLAEVLAASHSVDPAITIEAQSLLSELQHRSH